MITLNLTPVQYEIVRVAVMEYTDNLMQIIDPVTTVTVTKGESSVTAKVPNYPWDAPTKIEAPWGLKKDGTPKARPGRKTPAKVRKARA